MTAIVVEDVSKRFSTRWALAHVSLTVARGECVMLTGHNGSGKTTLLRLIAGISMPTAGRLSVLGADMKTQRPAARAAVSLLSHASGHYDDLTPRENLRVHATLLGVEAAKVDVVLDRVALAKRADTPVRQFSAGMKKRLSLARTMLKAPPVILLDEPFGELDPSGMTAVEEWIDAERKAGTTIVLATHWLDQGARLSDRQVKLVDGRVVA